MTLFYKIDRREIRHNDGGQSQNTKRTCPTCHELVEWEGIASKPHRFGAKTDSKITKQTQFILCGLWYSVARNCKTNPNICVFNRKTQTAQKTNPKRRPSVSLNIEKTKRTQTGRLCPVIPNPLAGEGSMEQYSSNKKYKTNPITSSAALCARSLSRRSLGEGGWQKTKRTQNFPSKNYEPGTKNYFVQTNPISKQTY